MICLMNSNIISGKNEKMQLRFLKALEPTKTIIKNLSKLPFYRYLQQKRRAFAHLFLLI
jgi:hypothetical protein